MNSTLLTGVDIWFHRYDMNGKGIEGRYELLVDDQTASHSLIGDQTCRRLQLVAGVMAGSTSCVTFTQRYNPRRRSVRSFQYRGCYVPQSTHQASLFTGYKEYRTHRKYLARMSDWRKNKNKEVKFDRIRGVNILVKADVHRSGKLFLVWALLLSQHL